MQIFLDINCIAAWHTSLLPPASSGELYVLLLNVLLCGRPKRAIHKMSASTQRDAASRLVVVIQKVIS